MSASEWRSVPSPIWESPLLSLDIKDFGCIFTQAQSFTMDASADATKPFLAEPKYRDSDVSEDWEPNSPRSCQNVRWLLWLVSGIIVLIFTNVATYFLARPSSDYLDKVCPSRTSVWCKLAFYFLK